MLVKKEYLSGGFTTMEFKEYKCAKRYFESACKECADLKSSLMNVEFSHNGRHSSVYAENGGGFTTVIRD